MNQGAAPACPVCGARFRGARECSRCGADLSVLLRILARAHRHREAARAALAAGDLPEATRQAARAEALHGTTAGRQLALVCELLNAGPANRSSGAHERS